MNIAARPAMSAPLLTIRMMRYHVMMTRMRIGANPPSTGDAGTPPTTDPVRINTTIRRIEREMTFLTDITHCLVRGITGLD